MGKGTYSTRAIIIMRLRLSRALTKALIQLLNIFTPNNWQLFEHPKSYTDFRLWLSSPISLRLTPRHLLILLHRRSIFLFLLIQHSQRSDRLLSWDFHMLINRNLLQFIPWLQSIQAALWLLLSFRLLPNWLCECWKEVFLALNYAEAVPHLNITATCIKVLWISKSFTL